MSSISTRLTLSVELTACPAVRPFSPPSRSPWAWRRWSGGGGGRLDAFFLDEGFGTLDPEHLDLAMEGVESLSAHRAQRLVVVVSHVPELRERIEDLLVLDKHPVTGDSLLVHGGAI